MSSLLDNNTYMRYNKFNTHSEDSIGQLKYINPIISLQHTTREKLPDALILVHINDDEMTAMSNKPGEYTEDPLKKNELLISAFDIHHKKVGNGNDQT